MPASLATVRGMSVNADAPDNKADAQRVAPIPELNAPSYLQSVLSIAYRDERNSVPLSVATPAGIVFGNAVHPAAWLRRLSEQLRELTNDDPHNESAQAMAGMFEQMAADREHDPGPDIPMKDIHWIYFTDALVTPVHNAVPSYQYPACWQIALRDVTGWTIGLPPE